MSGSKRGIGGWAAIAVAAAIALGACERPARGQVTADQVRVAITKAVKHLRSTQRDDGSWQDMGRRGGTTALNALALLAAGVPDDDPTVRKALAILDRTPNSDTYVVALKAMAYRYADAGRPAADRRYFKQLQAAATWLIEAQADSGTWSYGRTSGNIIGDNSNTQFALMGLHEAANGGVAVPPAVWRRSEEHFVKTQLSDGGWGYRYTPNPRSGGYGSMTAAGVASLYITGNRLDVSQESGYVNGAAPRCGSYRQNEAIGKGLLWLARNFAVDRNPGAGVSWTMYYLYTLERVGMISGHKFFGARDWYREGAERLVDTQGPDGNWARQSPVDTAFALLFLAKGNKPILFNKLQWGNPGDWDRDRNDIEHLVQFINAAELDGRKFHEQPAGWQVVNLRAPLVDLLDAPILYFNGHEFPRFTPPERAKLREFVEQGGTILAEACCSRKEFADGFRRFAREAWPEYPIERLADGHPVFSSFYTLDGNRWDLEGLQVGCRTSVMFAPRDLSCLWEQRDPRLAETDPAFRLGTNIAAYATGLERLKDKLERARVAEQHADPGRPGDIVRGALHIAALAHSRSALENMPDPNALPKFAEFLRDHARIDVVSRLLIIEPGDPELLNHPIMFMTGHNGFEYSEAQFKAIRTWLDRGGFLYANACCGRDAAVYHLPGDPKLTGDFGTSFRRMVERLYPSEKLAELPAEHPVRGTARGLFPVNRVTYRPEIQQKLQAANPRTAHDLRLEGLTVDGRLLIVYSPYAITCGLEDHKCFGCRGLLGRDAYRVSTNVILYALSQ